MKVFILVPSINGYQQNITSLSRRSNQICVSWVHELSNFSNSIYHNSPNVRTLQMFNVSSVGDMTHIKPV
ncbi:hypothetical protein L9F63_006818, partial [Diploptera punctata]